MQENLELPLGNFYDPTLDFERTTVGLLNQISRNILTRLPLFDSSDAFEPLLISSLCQMGTRLYMLCGQCLPQLAMTYNKLVDKRTVTVSLTESIDQILSLFNYDKQHITLLVCDITARWVNASHF